MGNVLSSSTSESSKSLKMSTAEVGLSSKPNDATKDSSNSNSLLTRIKTLKTKILAEEKSASSIETAVSKQVTALRGRLVTAKDDRSEGDTYENEAKKVFVCPVLTLAIDNHCLQWQNIFFCITCDNSKYLFCCRECSC